jgi:FAD/FMN-containing dehydrogenase
MKLSGWGRYPQLECRVLTARAARDVGRLVAGGTSVIARGNGRAYGDSAVNRHATLSMLGLNRMLAFDPASGLLTCEAGVLLADIVETFAPRGWFPMVTPGTKFVTVGGAIAADVHGKNHHGDGAFGDHVSSLDLLLADGRVVTCGPQNEPDLFAATRGGMGLTGIILRATVRLRPIETVYIRQETLRARNLDESLALFEASNGWSYSVAWIDGQARGAGLGRSILMRGEHARREELPPSLSAAPLALRRGLTVKVPFNLPDFTLNHLTVTAFNEVYYRLNKPGTVLCGINPFFYPLDAVLSWDRIYGPSGFFQYQCVLPHSASAEGLRTLLDTIARSGRGSFLAVLKLLGPQDGLMSFPMAGYTLALDFPADIATLTLANELDAIVADHGGRLYLAKDSRMGAGLLRRGYPGLDRFRAIKSAWDSRGVFRSLQSERLGYD